MAQDFARAFYRSKAWEKARAAKMRAADGLCERCLDQGRVTPATVVHHKVHLNRNNIKDPRIALGQFNLIALCRECHEAEHPEIYGDPDKRQRAPEPRVAFDADGNTVEVHGA